MERTYRGGTQLMSIVISGLGVAMVVSTIVRGGGPLALGVILGVMFVLLGAARFYLARR